MPLMQDRPQGLAERDLIAACRDGWDINAVETEYLPVGFGSYHWSLTDRAGAVWFVKVDDIELESFDAFQRAYGTALALHRDAGLDFVVAPVPTRRGPVLHRLSERYALSVFPMLAGVAGHFGPHRREDLPEMASVLARLHRATPTVAPLAPPMNRSLPGRDRLDEALHDLHRPWTAGPHSEPARKLLATHAELVQQWLTNFDRLIAEVGERTVITHGEPHPGNVIRTPAGLRLIDWGTAQLAPPERDLWLLTEGADRTDDEVFALYAAAGGQPVDPAGIVLYRQWWALADVAAFVDDLRRPHGDGEDAAAALTCLASYFDQSAK